MTKKLFKVEIDDLVYVMAKSCTEAEAEARYEISKSDIKMYAYEVKEDRYDSDWKDAIPYNSDDDKTVGEICEELKAQKEKKEYMEKHYQELPFK